MPEATAALWRNGWLHTGDGLRQDEEGRLYFVDRLKDALRRRGENISALEVEAAVNRHPDVAESAVIGVPAPGGEQDVLTAVVPRPGAAFDPADLLSFLTPLVPRFALPRYVRVVSDLPKTPTMKVRKAELRAAGITVDTWDREAAT